MARKQPSETGPWEPEPVCSPGFWTNRLTESDGEPHRAVFNGSLAHFRDIEAWQRERLAGQIQPRDSVLDAGCGYGRLLDLLPAGWRGRYLGVDICPDFVALARRSYPGAEFRVADLRSMPFLPDGSFDVAVCVWMRAMVLKNVGEGAWGQIERELSRVARRVVVVETPTKETD